MQRLQPNPRLEQFAGDSAENADAGGDPANSTIGMQPDQPDRNNVPPDHDPLIGTRFDNKFEVLELAGQGGMSNVYKVRHLLTQKIVALKVMHLHLVRDANSVRRFQREATAAGRLQHPNSISVWDMGVIESTGQPYLFMDYLEGISLAQGISRAGKIEPSRALHIFEQSCAALQDAHEHGIFHRDLKPSNIMLIKQGDDPDFVKVVDYGIAKLTEDEGDELKLTQTGEVFGSPLYMSPEQCQGNPVDARSDVYSMGCLMYEALMGHPPLEGSNVMDTMHKHLNIEPDPIKLPDSAMFANRINKVVQKALAKDPNNRYASMSDLLKQIRHLKDWLTTRKSTDLGPFAKMEMAAGDALRVLRNTISEHPKKAICVALLVPPLLIAAIISAISVWWYQQNIAPPMMARMIPIAMGDPPEVTQLTDRMQKRLAMAQVTYTTISSMEKQNLSTPNDLFRLMEVGKKLYEMNNHDTYMLASQCFGLSKIIARKCEESGQLIGKSSWAEIYYYQALCAIHGYVGETIYDEWITDCDKAADYTEALESSARELLRERYIAARLCDRVIKDHLPQKHIDENIRTKLFAKLYGVLFPTNSDDARMLNQAIQGNDHELCVIYSWTSRAEFENKDFAEAAKAADRAAYAWTYSSDEHKLTYRASCHNLEGMALECIANQSPQSPQSRDLYMRALNQFDEAERDLRNVDGGNPAYLVGVLYNNADVLQKLGERYKSWWVENMQARRLQSELGKK